MDKKKIAFIVVTVLSVVASLVACALGLPYTPVDIDYDYVSDASLPPDGDASAVRNGSRARSRPARTSGCAPPTVRGRIDRPDTTQGEFARGCPSRPLRLRPNAKWRLLAVILVGLHSSCSARMRAYRTSS